METLLRGSRDELVLALDDTLLGIRPGRRPCSASPETRSFRRSGTDTSHLPGYGRGMDERSRVAAGVLARLERIERCGRRGPASELLDELRALVPEAEAWARVEGDARARAAAAKLRAETKE